jgi:hypothetical protein
MPEPIANRDVAELEAALKGLAPSAVRLQRDLLLFRAGQASVRRPTWLWPTAAAVLAIAVAVLAALLSLRPGPEVITRTIVVQVPPAPVKTALPPKLPEQTEPSSLQPTPPPAPDTVVWGPLPGGYLRQRQDVLRWGVDALPMLPTRAGAVVPSRPMTAQDLSEWLPQEKKSSPTPGGSS